MAYSLMIALEDARFRASQIESDGGNPFSFLFPYIQSEDFREGVSEDLTLFLIDLKGYFALSFVAMQERCQFIDVLSQLVLDEIDALRSSNLGVYMVWDPVFNGLDLYFEDQGELEEIRGAALKSLGRWIESDDQEVMLAGIHGVYHLGSDEGMALLQKMSLEEGDPVVAQLLSEAIEGRLL